MSYKVYGAEEYMEQVSIQCFFLTLVHQIITFVFIIPILGSFRKCDPTTLTVRQTFPYPRVG